MRLLNHANLPASLIAAIETELSNQENLQDVMNWPLSHPPDTFLPEVVGAVVVQDEFTHDVIVPWRDGLVLVYDTT